MDCSQQNTLGSLTQMITKICVYNVKVIIMSKIKILKAKRAIKEIGVRNEICQFEFLKLKIRD